MLGSGLRILITGGAGFVGSSLALRLREARPEDRIVCMDNLHRKGSILNRKRLEDAGVAFVKKDVRDSTAFKMPRFDLIIDAAAEPSVVAGKSGESGYVVNTNLTGTLNTLEAAKTWSSAMLFISTSRVFPLKYLRAINLEEGSSRFELSSVQDVPGVSLRGISEDFPLRGPRTLYGATKYAAEIMVEEYSRQFGLEALVDRCGVLAGPWQMGKVDQGVVALWVAAHHYNMPLSYIGYGGKQVRDILHIDDFADLALTQLEDRSRWQGQVWNVGGGMAGSVSLIELTELAREATGKYVEIGSVPDVREGDVPLFFTDCTRISEEWNWWPSSTPAQIVADTAGWIKDNEDKLKTIFKR